MTRSLWPITSRADDRPAALQLWRGSGSLAKRARGRAKGRRPSLTGRGTVPVGPAHPGLKFEQTGYFRCLSAAGVRLIDPDAANDQLPASYAQPWGVPQIARPLARSTIVYWASELVGRFEVARKFLGGLSERVRTCLIAHPRAEPVLRPGVLDLDSIEEVFEVGGRHRLDVRLLGLSSPRHSARQAGRNGRVMGPRAALSLRSVLRWLGRRRGRATAEGTAPNFRQGNPGQSAVEPPARTRPASTPSARRCRISSRYIRSLPRRSSGKRADSRSRAKYASPWHPARTVDAPRLESPRSSTAARHELSTTSSLRPDGSVILVSANRPRAGQIPQARAADDFDPRLSRESPSDHSTAGPQERPRGTGGYSARSVWND